MNPRLKNKYGLVSNTVVREPNICLRAKGLYAYLATYANSDNELTVSIDRIANECGITQSTVKRILEELKQAGIIERVKRGQKESYKTILLK